MRFFIATISIALMVSLFYVFNTFYMVENTFTDRMTADTKEASRNIQIIAIDDESLEQIGKWPWPRQTVAQLSKELVEYGATAVFVDIAYTEKSQNAAEDAAWEEVLQAHENIYLPIYFNFAKKQTSKSSLNIESTKYPVFSMSEEAMGHINVIEDRDRVVRRVMLGIKNENNEMIPAISVKLANLLLEEGEKITWDENNNWYKGGELLPTGLRNEVIFTYSSSPSEPSFKVHSFYKVASGEVPAAAFTNSIVLIGPYTVGLQDQYYTPMSKTLKMNGVEIHANIIQSLYSNDIFSSASKTTGIALIVIISIFTALVIYFLKGRFTLLTTLGFIVVYTITFFVAYYQYHVILPFTYVILAILFIYVSFILIQFIQERLERQKVTKIFGRYVSQNIVDELLAEENEVTVGGERKDVTLMFIDVRGFTPLSEKIQPEEVINILNEYLELCTKAIFKHEGTIDKFMGDGVMVIFGAPIKQEDHAIRAAKTALLLKEESINFAKKLEKLYGRSVSFGMGLNSGPAVIGNIGSEDRLDYTAIGDTVNLAARLESNAKPGQILISHETYERIKGEIVCEKLEPLKVKGKEKPINVYQIEKEVGK
jgi:adenylate cyclase